MPTEDIEERFNLLIHQDLAEKYTEMRERVEDLEAALRLARESTDKPQWIVNDNAELGVLVNGRAWFLYKGSSLGYDDGTDMLFRFVGKREFGECCEPAVRTIERAQAQHDPEVRARLSAQYGQRYLDGDGWRPLKQLAEGVESALKAGNKPFDVEKSHASGESSVQTGRRDLGAFKAESGGAFKGVLWPRPPVQLPDGRLGYPVAVVGVAVLDRPLFEGNEIVLAGACPGLGDALDKVARGHSRHRLGDASEVLTSLDYAVGTGPAPCEEDFE